MVAKGWLTIRVSSRSTSKLFVQINHFYTKICIYILINVCAIPVKLMFASYNVYIFCCSVTHVLLHQQHLSLAAHSPFFVSKSREIPCLGADAMANQDPEGHLYAFFPLTSLLLLQGVQKKVVSLILVGSNWLQTIWF